MQGGSSARSHDNSNAASAAHGSGFARSHQTASAAGSGSSNQFERSHHFDHLDSSHTSRGLHDASRSSDLHSHHHGSSNANSHSHNAHGGGGVTVGGFGVNGNGGSGESNSHHTSNVAGATNGTEREVSRASETSDAAAKRRAGGSSSAGGQSHHAHRSGEWCKTSLFAFVSACAAVQGTQCMLMRPQCQLRASASFPSPLAFAWAKQREGGRNGSIVSYQEHCLHEHNTLSLHPRCVASALAQT